MKTNKHLYWSLVLSLLPFWAFGASRIEKDLNDVFIIIYVTQNGTTGHVGIAVDNYSIAIRDVLENGLLVSREDTIKKGNLTFFDLWPQKDLKYGEMNRNTEPQYFRLPRSSAEPAITVETILEKGLPHRYRTPCDAMLRISTRPDEDFKLLAFIDSLPQTRPAYNARHYNCADFAVVCLQQLLHRHIRAKEFVPMSWISTPNKLYRECTRKLPVEVLRDPGKKVKHSFFKERILKSLFDKKSRHEKN